MSTVCRCTAAIRSAIRLTVLCLLSSTLSCSAVCGQALGTPQPSAEEGETQEPNHSSRPADDAAALGDDPYVVFVAQAESHARCGPSGEFYRTDPLRHGQELEVFVETPDGWLGVRPPEASFSWILADAVEADSNGNQGTVIEDRSVSWIGTHLGRARRYRWQIQLAEGERVTILGRSQREGPDGPQLWYRIVPPSGEFRWVHRDQVVETPEELVASVRPNTEIDVAFLPSEPTRSSDRIEEVKTAKGKAVDAPNVSRDTVAGGAGDPHRHGKSVLERASSELEAIGSGLISALRPQKFPADRRDRPEAEQPDRKLPSGKATLASAEFISRPRLHEIGNVNSAPTLEQPADSNWVSGVHEAPESKNRLNGTAMQPDFGGVQIVSSTSKEVPNVASASPEASPWQSTSRSPLAPTPAPLLRSLRTVSSESIARVEEQARGASVDSLQLLLSRLMAERVSAAEVEPVRRAAGNIANQASDEVVVGRARLLFERSEQYQRIARRRDGDTVVRTDSQADSRTPQAPPSLPAAMRSADESSSAPDYAQQATVAGDVAEADGVVQTGTLIAVYSAREHSPPYALIDSVGETVAYVTPAPGVDLRRHLNNQIRVQGELGYLPGISTPQILVRAADRSRN